MGGFKKNVSVVKNFLEGNDTCVVLDTGNCNVILPKIPLSESVVGFYVARNYRDAFLPEKFESEFVFAFFPKKKAVLFTPSSHSYYMERTLDFSCDRRHQNSDIADALGYKVFEQENIAETTKGEYKKNRLERILSDFPDFDSLPDDVKEEALENRNKILSSGDKKDFLPNERMAALLSESEDFRIYIPDMDDFALACEYVLYGKGKALSLLESKETEESKREVLLDLAYYYLRQSGIEKAKQSMSENDKKKMAWGNAVSNTHAKELTVIYDAKKIADRLADVRERMDEYSYGRKETWKKIFAYLDKNEQLVFKVSKDGICVTDRFIRTYHTDMTNKHVFGLSRYAHIPSEFDVILDDLDNLVDIRYRNKTILNFVA